jgi:hypothetical protein
LEVELFTCDLDDHKRPVCVESLCHFGRRPEVVAPEVLLRFLKQNNRFRVAV